MSSEGGPAVPAGPVSLPAVQRASRNIHIFGYTRTKKGEEARCMDHLILRQAPGWALPPAATALRAAAVTGRWLYSHLQMAESGLGGRKVQIRPGCGVGKAEPVPGASLGPQLRFGISESHTTSRSSPLVPHGCDKTRRHCLPSGYRGSAHSLGSAKIPICSSI